MSVEKAGKLYGPLILLAGVLFVYAYFFSLLDSSYAPYYGDEYFYYKNSEVFFAKSRLEATFTYSGHGSRLLGIDAHGPAYPLLYGLISKITGWHRLSIPIINLLIFVGSVLALFSLVKTDNVTRTCFALLVLGSPVTLFYSVTFLPELIHLAGGILLFAFCRNYLRALATSDFLWLLGLILVLGCIRNTWFFALFGLIVIPGPVKGFKKIVYLIFGTLLPFLFQHFFHEQVPNAFSDFGELLVKRHYVQAFDKVFFNIQRNLYFALNYTEGWFYTVQKLWQAMSILFALIFFRKNKLIQFGLVALGILIVFNVILYKYYTWVDLRLNTPLVFFLNLGMIYHSKNQDLTGFLLLLNLASFVLALPLQRTVIGYRNSPDVIEIPQTIIEQIRQSSSGTIYLSPDILNEYSIYQLPFDNKFDQPLRYILPYYSMPYKVEDHRIELQDSQLRVEPKKILNQ